MGPLCDFGWRAPDFTLPATDGRMLSLADIQGAKGTVIVFMCNHCPYVLRGLDRLQSDVFALQAVGIGVAAICSNDAQQYPEDSFERMQALATERQFSFPYLQDESQAVARAYDAVCTPDFFGFDSTLGLQYRGRLDDQMGQGAKAPIQRDLFNAMIQVGDTGTGPAFQTPSMGCSIKWKAS